MVGMGRSLNVDRGVLLFGVCVLLRFISAFLGQFCFWVSVDFFRYHFCGYFRTESGFELAYFS